MSEKCTFFHFFDFFDFFPLSLSLARIKVHQKKKTRSPARHRPPLVTRARAHYKRECEGDRFLCVENDDDE